MTDDLAPPANRPDMQIALEKSEASLALVRQRMEGELSTCFTGADARLNPARLLKRLSAAQQTLHELRAIAAANETARREILGDLQASCAANQERVIGAHIPLVGHRDSGTRLPLSDPRLLCDRPRQACRRRCRRARVGGGTR